MTQNWLVKEHKHFTDKVDLKISLPRNVLSYEFFFDDSYFGVTLERF